MINHNDYASLIRARAIRLAGIDNKTLALQPGVDTIVYQAAQICVGNANADDNEKTMEAAAQAIYDIWRRLKLTTGQN